MSLNSQPLPIKSLHHDYSVHFHEKIASVVDAIMEKPNALFVIDKRLVELYGSELRRVLDRRPVFAVEAVESSKSLAGVEKFIDWLLENSANRSSLIVGIGGGIIQDLVTFTSGIYYRGTPFALVPTTLLSMCDSCIGAKCGINHGSFKNQLGVIHAPREVHIASSFLDTLSDNDVKSGYGEVLKLAITGSRQAFDNLVAKVSTSGLRGEHVLGLIRQSLEIKREIIELDEYEADLRRILNYGHTFGHALESLTDHAIPHGLAVAWGIDLINFLAKDRGTETGLLQHETHRFVAEHLSFELEDFPSGEQFMSAIRRDKKMDAGHINLVLPEGFGELRIVPTSIDGHLLDAVSSYLEESNVFSPVRG